MPNPITAAALEARSFYKMHPSPDARWYVEEVLIPQLSTLLDAYARQQVGAFRERAAFKAQWECCGEPECHVANAIRALKDASPQAS